jgi:hypothetical protein
MKKTIQIAALSIILCGAMIGCRPEKKTLGPKPSQTEGISNTGWILSRVDQIDVPLTDWLRKAWELAV